MKRLLLVLAVVFGLTMFVLPVTVSADAGAICNVGEDGQCKAKAKDNDKVLIWLSNKANVWTNSTAVASTGGNNQSGNDDGNKMRTGAASASTSTTTTVNTTSVKVTQN